MNGKNDVSTLLIAHIKSIRATGRPDDTTNLVNDIPTMQATQNHASKDLTTDYYVYLQSHA